MTAKVSIFREGAPTGVAAIATFLAEHVRVEELRDVLEAFKWKRCYALLDAAGPFLARMYEAGDEDVSWAEITCPDYDQHGPDGCRTCGRQALRHEED